MSAVAVEVDFQKLRLAAVVVAVGRQIFRKPAAECFVSRKWIDFGRGLAAVVVAEAGFQMRPVGRTWTPAGFELDRQILTTLPTAVVART